MALCIAAAQTSSAQQSAPPTDFVQVLVDRLDLQDYKTTLKGLTKFGDRREGTQRNRDAVGWIEQQLEHYGCETARMTYELPPPRTSRSTREAPAIGRIGAPRRDMEGGSSHYGTVGPTGVNEDPARQPDEALRALNMGPVLPGPIPQGYCTKWGTSRRGEMYIIGAHMDGIGYGEAANDDGSGTALVMELARIFSMADVSTDVSIRFALWNGEESGLHGAAAYVAQRQRLQGQPDEPIWLGMIQHDMMMWDHGMPGTDGTLPPAQRPEADFNIEWQSGSKQSAGSMQLALAVKLAADRYTTDYPGTLGPHMTNTDSGPFMDVVPAISLRENERGMNTGAGWNPHWHQPTDLFATYSDADFRLGLNAAQATLAAVAQLAGARAK